MEAENLNIEEISEERRKAVTETIKQLNAQELSKLIEGLFTYAGDPWFLKLEEFIAENPQGTFYHGTTNDLIQVIYCLEKEKGLWFIPGKGIGVLGARGLKNMKEIVSGG